MVSEPTQAEKLATVLIKAIDPELELVRKEVNTRNVVEAGELVLCEDLETMHPTIYSLMLVRDAIWIQRLKDRKPTLEGVSWGELCDGLRDAAFAALSTIYSHEYMKVEYIGTGVRALNGKVAFVMRPANEQERKLNIDAQKKMEAIQKMWDAAHEVMEVMKEERGESPSHDHLLNTFRPRILH